MNVAARWTCLALALVGCGKPAELPPAANPSTPAVAAPATSREILVDLARWDAATTADRRAAAEDVARRVPDFALLRLETFSCGGQTHEVAIYRHTKTEMEFVLVPGGTFVMGSPDSEVGRQRDENRHTVTLTRPFMIAQTECTQSAYERVVGSNPSADKGPALPVELVSWGDSKAFCANSGLSLPTEAQWEYACRAGTTTAYCSGDAESDLGNCGWYESDSHSSTHAVGGKRVNAFGLFDVHGNVWEWCEDRFGLGGYPSGAATDPTGPGDGSMRVMRGGSSGNTAVLARSAARYFGDPVGGGRLTGFRPAKTVSMD